MQSRGEERAVSPVIGVVLLVSIVVVLASVVSVLAISLGQTQQEPAPRVTLSHELVDDGGEKTVAITLTSGQAVATDHLYVIGSADLDIGGAPGTATPADEAQASSREKFTESTGANPPQVGIGDTWEAGETVYLDPVGSADGVTIRIYWSAREVTGVNPGTVQDDTAYRIAELTV
jgi:flagellin-like protein